MDMITNPYELISKLFNLLNRAEAVAHRWEQLYTKYVQDMDAVVNARDERIKQLERELADARHTIDNFDKSHEYTDEENEQLREQVKDLEEQLGQGR
jgi:chromosome segregation ATPase